MIFKNNWGGQGNQKKIFSHKLCKVLNHLEVDRFDCGLVSELAFLVLIMHNLFVIIDWLKRKEIFEFLTKIFKKFQLKNCWKSVFN